MNTVEAIRRRMSDGAPDDGDLFWCKQRLAALRGWPDGLSVEQAAEIDTLVEWMQAHG